MKFTPKALRHTDDASRGHRTIWEAKTEFVALAAFFGLLIVVTIFFADLFSALIPDRSEAILAPVLVSTLSDKVTDEKDLEYQRAKAVFTRIMQAKNKRDLDYRFVYLKSETPNAFAAPGGAIGVTSGLLTHVKSEIGLAMVIAHELGHHYHRHVMRTLSRSVLLSVLMAITFGDNLDAIEDGIELTLMKFSRDQEYEADEFGIRVVKDLYGQTDGTTEFFEKMLNTKYSAHESPFSEITSSHPLTAKRIDRLKKMGRELDTP
jgi:predicted Zn-dependent protease